VIKDWGKARPPPQSLITTFGRLMIVKPSRKVVLPAQQDHQNDGKRAIASPFADRSWGGK